MESISFSQRQTIGSTRMSLNIDEPNIDYIQSLSFDELVSEYISLKKKYIKLYRENNLLLKSCEAELHENEKLLDARLYIKSLQYKISEQEQEISDLKSNVNDLSTRLDQKISSNRCTDLNGSCFIYSNSYLQLCIASVELNEDFGLLNDLIDKLMLKKIMPEYELSDYKSIIQHMEKKFEEISYSINYFYR
jgi:predicted  nucleic acid-binding Zn-ribbon protein